MAEIKRKGFGQVEPNHLSAQRNGQVYGQLPCHKAANEEDVPSITILENGQFVKYDYANNEVNYTGKGEWMLVFNEVHVYDERDRYYKDFALKASDYIGGEITPRVMKTMPGDIFTTNTIEVGNTDKNAEVVIGDTDTLKVGATLGINANGFLSLTGDKEAMEWQIVKVYDMPDGQPAVKVMRIK